MGLLLAMTVMRKKKKIEQMRSSISLTDIFYMEGNYKQSAPP